MKELNYTQVGDYLLPAVECPEKHYEPLGKYGMMHQTYLENHKRPVFVKLWVSNQLQDYLHQIDDQANEMLKRLIAEELKVNPAPDKSKDPIGWAHHMMKLKDRAEETVLNDIVYN